MTSTHLTVLIILMLPSEYLSVDVLRLLTNQLSWNNARENCKSVGGTLAKVSSADLDDMKLCPDFQNETKYWTAGYDFLTPWFELTGCYQIVNTLTSTFKSADEQDCYPMCKHTKYFGLQNGRCICLDDPFESLSLTLSSKCIACSDESKYSCGTNGYLALYEPYFQSVDKRFCVLEKNETCDCGAFQCEPAPVGDNNDTWVYYSRNCTLELETACSGGQFMNENLEWINGRQVCIDKGEYMSGPNIENWCNTSNATKRKPYWGHMHRDRVVLYADSTDITDKENENIDECQYVYVSNEEVKFGWTPACAETRGYICKLEWKEWNANDCYITTTIPSTTTTEAPTTTTTQETTSTPETTTTTPIETSTEIESSTSPTKSSTKEPTPVPNVQKQTGLSEEERTGMIVGIVVGALLIVIIVMIVCRCRHETSKSQKTENEIKNGGRNLQMNNNTGFPNVQETTNNITNKQYEQLESPEKVISHNYDNFQSHINGTTSPSNVVVNVEPIAAPLPVFEAVPDEADDRLKGDEDDDTPPTPCLPPGFNENASLQSSLKSGSLPSLQFDDSNKSLNGSAGETEQPPSLNLENYPGPVQTIEPIAKPIPISKEESTPEKPRGKFVSVIDISTRM